MTVRELIEKLSTLPQELEVRVRTPYDKIDYIETVEVVDEASDPHVFIG